MRGQWKRWLAWWVRHSAPVDGDLWTKRGPLARRRAPSGRLEPGPRPARVIGLAGDRSAQYPPPAA